MKYTGIGWVACTLITLGAPTLASAQSTLGGMLAAGYAAGLDTPVLADGALSVRGAVWIEQRAGLELGLMVGRDQFEDRTVRTAGLYRNPVTGGIGTTPCTGCIAGAFEQRSRDGD